MSVDLFLTTQDCNFNFESLSSLVQSEGTVVKTYQHTLTLVSFRSVEDVDMYTGGLSEKPVEGGMLGPTMTCLIANQFVRMKTGDRYWYETPEQPQAFTAGKSILLLRIEINN